jgi:hypothetical protein
MCSSQDHIELFFGKIRTLGGCNNNPTLNQFKAAYQKLLVHNDIQDVVRGNCIPLQNIQISTISSKNIVNSNANTPSIYALNNSSIRNRILDNERPSHDTLNNDDTAFLPIFPNLSAVCSENIVAYIAGFVVKKMKQSLHCEPCIPWH